jgi:hypothetical protein
MSDTKYTPGPWYFRPEEPSVEAEHTEHEGFFATVAKCGDSRTLPPTQMHANARLIASAPELAEALRQILEAHDLFTTEGGFLTNKLAQETRAALRKAGVL